MKRDIAIIKAWVNKKGDLDHYPNLSEALSGKKYTLSSQMTHLTRSHVS